MSKKFSASQISVIIPVYKVEPYLDRCVQSILEQTFSDFDLILVDDGSPDNCPAMCDEWAGRDPRIVVIHQKNGGPSAARNAGIDWAFANSNSEWLIFVDSDDWGHPEMLEQLLIAVMEQNVAVSVCDVIEVINECEPSKLDTVTVIDYESERFFSEKPVLATIPTGKLYKKELFSELRYPIGKIHEDEYVTYKALFANAHIAYVHTALYYYFSNPMSITRSSWSNRRLDAVYALEERIEFFRKCQNQKMVEYSKLQLISRIAWLNLQAYAAHDHRNFPAKYRQGFLKSMYLLEKINGTDRYESIMFKIFPKVVKCQAKIRKAIWLVFKKEIKKERLI